MTDSQGVSPYSVCRISGGGWHNIEFSVYTSIVCEVCQALFPKVWAGGVIFLIMQIHSVPIFLGQGNHSLPNILEIQRQFCWMFCHFI